MRQLNYAFVPECPLDTPLCRKGWRPAKPRPRPYPKPAASVGTASILAAKRQPREDPRPIVPAPPAQFNDIVFPDALAPERFLNTPLSRKAQRPVKPKPRPYPKPVASVGASSRRQLREDARPLILAPPVQNVVVFQDNYGFPPPVSGYVSESDDMEIDATGPAFIPVAPTNTTYGIPLIVGYLPELPEAMEVDWEGPSIQTGPSYHPAFNVPPPSVMIENVRADHFENPHNSVIGAYHALPPNAGLIDPPYDPRQPLFTAPPILNAGVQVVAAEEHPGDHTELFNELFGDDGEEEEEEDIAFWGGGGNLVGGHGNDEGEDEDEVEIVI